MLQCIKKRIIYTLTRRITCQCQPNHMQCETESSKRFKIMKYVLHYFKTFWSCAYIYILLTREGPSDVVWSHLVQVVDNDAWPVKHNDTLHNFDSQADIKGWAKHKKLGGENNIVAKLANNQIVIVIRNNIM